MIQFDTRDKKPKLYNIAALSVITAAVIAALVLTGADKHALPMSVVLGVYLIAVFVMLIAAFFKQLQYNPYSYNTIYYAGFALFVLSVLIMHVILVVRQICSPYGLPPEQIVFSLLDSARNFMILSTPFVLIFSAALCASNISLIRHEGRRLVNVLGIILSIILLGGIAVLYLFDRFASGSLDEIRVHALITSLYSGVFLYFECMLIGVIIAFAVVVRHPPAPDRDFVIVLGCGIRSDGTPTPLLRGRLDRALAFDRMQRETTGRALTFVTSGGQGPDEVISESAAMKRYLIEQGVSEDRIIEEDRSTDTAENMAFSKEKIAAVDPNGAVAFSTTNYHVFRSGLCARRVKMRAVGMGAPTKWYFWPNAAVREFVGLLTEHRGKQAVILGSMIAIYTILTLIAYRS